MAGVFHEGNRGGGKVSVHGLFLGPVVEVCGDRGEDEQEHDAPQEYDHQLGIPGEQDAINTPQRRPVVSTASIDSAITRVRHIPPS